MAASFRNSRARAALALVLPLLIPDVASAAELLRPGDAFSYEADIVTTELRTQTLEISGNVRVTQGTNSIQSGAAKAIGPSENSRWSFQKGVRIVTSEAELDSDSADATVVGGQISQARAQGSPAQFQQRGGSAADRQIRGRAGVIEYDLVAGVVKLTDQVWFSNGKDEFRGDVLIYNVRDERVQSQGRVRGIIRPQGKTTVSPPTPAQPESGE
jgi:lipopolysaccharide transport protein LptA